MIKFNEAITSTRKPQKGISMQTVVKQPQPKVIVEPALVPDGVKKLIQQTPDTESGDKTMSGNLSRLLDASSDCV